MPIYAYKCESCGHRQDILQKVSEPLLQICPACAQPRFVKQLTAAGFQLKGSGWYATDFKGGKKPAGAKPDATADTKADAKTETKSETKSETKTEAKPEKKAPASTAN